MVTWFSLYHVSALERLAEFASGHHLDYIVDVSQPKMFTEALVK